MKKLFAFACMLCLWSMAQSAQPDSVSAIQYSVLVIPYMPAMHLSDADVPIAQGSDMQIPEVRAELRRGIVKELNKSFAEIYNMKGMKRDFVRDDNNDIDAVYHSVMFERDSVYTLKYPAKFAIKDTTQVKKGTTKPKKDEQYINSVVSDESLIPELTKRFESDYMIFLNELDIQTHSEDCLNLALQIYRRDLKVHYSIYDKNGKQVYGDVAVSHFGSNSNDVNEIMKENFPTISKYILASMDRVTKDNGTR